MESLRDQLLHAHAHQGHLKKTSNPLFKKEYVFMEREGRHIINLDQTIEQLNNIGEQLKELIAEGEKILFVACKKQAKHIVRTIAEQEGLYYITKKWPAGTLTNFPTVKKQLHKITSNQDKRTAEYQKKTKKEQLVQKRNIGKQNLLYEGIATMRRPADALFVIDAKNEKIAVLEAKKLNIPTYGVVDSNTDPLLVNYPIVANDDRLATIQVIMNHLAAKIREGKEILAQKKGYNPYITPSETATNKTPTTDKTKTKVSKSESKKPQPKATTDEEPTNTSSRTAPPKAKGTSTTKSKPKTQKTAAKATTEEEPTTIPTQKSTAPPKAKDTTTTKSKTNTQKTSVTATGEEPTATTKTKAPSTKEEKAAVTKKEPPTPKG